MKYKSEGLRRSTYGQGRMLRSGDTNGQNTGRARFHTWSGSMHISRKLWCFTTTWEKGFWRS